MLFGQMTDTRYVALLSKHNVTIVTKSLEQVSTLTRNHSHQECHMG